MHRDPVTASDLAGEYPTTNEIIHMSGFAVEASCPKNGPTAARWIEELV